jgi:hypothetical protein
MDGALIGDGDQLFPRCGVKRTFEPDEPLEMIDFR